MEYPIEYPYKINVITILVGTTLFGGLAYLMYQQAITNDRGLIIDRVIHLGIHGASVFFGVIAAILASGALLLLVSIVTSFFGDKTLRLTEYDLQVPFGITQETITIPYSQISQMQIQQVQKQVFLVLLYQGKKINILRSRLSEEQFEKVRKVIADHIQNNAQ